MMDLISIIIPVYNAELFLDECIKSLIKQTYKNLEIIFIDDGSKDESKKIIEKYLNIDSRIKYFYKENGGACSARNKGLEEMTGEYVCFVDSDDYVENDYVNKLYSSIKENKANIACCNFSRVNEKCKKIHALCVYYIQNKKITDKQSIYTPCLSVINAIYFMK